MNISYSMKAKELINELINPQVKKISKACAE